MTNLNRRRNAYAGRCSKCGLLVEEGAGYLADLRGRLRPYHEACLPENSAPVPESAIEDVPEDEVANAATEDDLKVTAEEVVQQVSASFLALVPAMVKDEVLKATHVLEIKVGAAPKVKLDTAHRALPDVLRAVAAQDNPYLVGPAGSGKTTLARQVAEVLKRSFYAENRVTSEFKLLGFMNAQGKYVRTQFRDAYEKGGVFLFDEVDASDPDAMVALNSAIENGICPFPDKLVTMHKDFVCIAAGNTFGRGADRQYVGRNQLDASTLDRFCIIEVDYDEDLEMKLAGNAEWTRFVQKVRNAVDAEKIRMIVSPRASIYGARLLAAGEPWESVAEKRIWKGLDRPQRERVESRMNRVGGL